MFTALATVLALSGAQGGSHDTLPTTLMGRIDAAISPESEEFTHALWIPQIRVSEHVTIRSFERLIVTLQTSGLPHPHLYEGKTLEWRTPDEGRHLAVKPNKTVTVLAFLFVEYGNEIALYMGSRNFYPILPEGLSFWSDMKFQLTLIPVESVANLVDTADHRELFTRLAGPSPEPSIGPAVGGPQVTFTAAQDNLNGDWHATLVNAELNPDDDSQLGARRVWVWCLPCVPPESLDTEDQECINRRCDTRPIVGQHVYQRPAAASTRPLPLPIDLTGVQPSSAFDANDKIFFFALVKEFRISDGADAGYRAHLGEVIEVPANGATKTGYKFTKCEESSMQGPSQPLEPDEDDGRP